MIDGQLWLFKKCDVNLTINPIAHSLYHQNADILGIAAEDVGEQQLLREAPYVYCCLSLSCLWPSQQICSIQPVWYCPTMPFSALHENLHSLSGWENPDWLELFSLLKHSIQRHSFQKHLHYFSSCHSRKTIHTLTVYHCCHKADSRWGTLLAAILLVIIPLQPEDRQNQLQPSHLTMHHFHWVLFSSNRNCAVQ